MTEPYHQDNYIKIYLGDCRAMTELNKHRFGYTGVITGFNLIKQCSSQCQFLFRDIGLWQASMFGPLQAFPQFHTNFSLSFLNSEIRKQYLDTKISLKITCFPRVKWFAVLGRRFLDTPITTKSTMKHIHYLGADLLKSNSFIKDWSRSIANFAEFVCITLDSYIAITINTASQICFVLESNIVKQFRICFCHTYIIPRYGGKVNKIRRCLGGEVLCG